MRVNEYLIDQIMVISSLVFNVFIVFLFIFRAYERPDQERRLGYLISLLILPFTYVWVTNLMGGRDTGRLITGFPVIVFILYDYWYAREPEPCGEYPASMSSTSLA